MIIEFKREFQAELEKFFEIVLAKRGWKFEPEGKHSIIRNIEAEFCSNRGGFWLYTMDDRIIGTIALRQIDKSNNIGEIKSMYVLPNYQGKGYGKELLTYTLGQAKNLGYEYVRLDTTLDSERAIKLYKMAGFYEIERYNENKTAELFMEIMI